MEIQSITWNKKTYKEFQAYLVSLKDLKYLAFHSKLVTSNHNLIGIRIPILRQLAKEIKATDGKKFLEVMEHKYYEEDMLYGFVTAELCKDKKLSDEERKQYIRNFVPHVDNWAVCDSCCSSFKFMRKQPEVYIPLVEEFLNQEGEFPKRVGFALLLFQFMDNPYYEFIFDCCTKYITNQYYVQMVVAWLLSMCYVKEKDATLTYLNQNHLDEFTYKKTISKILESNQIDKEEKKWVRSHLKR